VLLHTHIQSYTQFLLPGVLSTSMLSIGMFGSMSMIQDKRFGYLKRILITPARRTTVFLAKALGATTRGLIQFPVMIVAAYFFGVRYGMVSPLMWAGWFLCLFLLGLGFSALYLIVTSRSTDWQTPGVLSNFMTMPLMFASTALFPQSSFPWWMQDISTVNPVTYSALFGRDALLSGVAQWDYLGALVLFAAAMLSLGVVVYSRWLRVE
ncbi:MAG: ABC transporter permease, partial [Thermoplasmata archaeon]